MPMVAEGAATAFFTFKSVVDLAKSVMDLASTAQQREQAVKLYGAVLDAQERSLAAQAAQAVLVEEKRELERQLAEFETWEREKKRYQMEKVGAGFAYALKADAAGSEPPHHICAQCYEARKKSVLHSRYQQTGRITLYVCPGCKTEFAS